MTIGDVLYGIVWDPRIWYLPALFISFVFVGGAFVLARGWKWWPVPTLVALGALTWFTHLSWWPPLLIVHPFTIYMFAGVIFGGWATRVGLASRRKALLFGGSSLVFAGVVAALLPSGLGSDFSLTFTACALPGVVMFVALGRLIDGLAVGRGLAVLGRWSLVIYVIHAVPTSIARTLLLRAGVTDYSALVFGSALVGVAVPAAVAWIMDRGYVRWLITMPGYRRNTRLP